LLVLFASVGVYRPWSGMLKPAHVNWALLPGTVVSEMAYIFGCLITGGEIRRARLMPSKSRRGRRGDESEPATEDSPGVKVLGPIVAALLALVACLAAILVLRWLLGSPVIDRFILSGGVLSTPEVARRLPGSWDGFWAIVVDQVRLLQHTCEFWTELEWLNWRVPLFVYLSICLSVRLAPAGRDLRWTLVGAAAVAAVIALVGAVSDRFTDLIRDLWPLLTYVWAVVLFLLVVTLLIRGLIALGKVLAGKG
jgi:hypothetical protein